MDKLVRFGVSTEEKLLKEFGNLIKGVKHTVFAKSTPEKAI